MFVVCITKIFVYDSLPLKMGPIGFPEMSERNYRYSLRNDPEEYRFLLLRVGSLKQRKHFKIYVFLNHKYRRLGNFVAAMVRVGE